MNKLDRILKQRGLMSTKELDDLMNNQAFISTGYPEIDALIREPDGGFPRGCLSEVCGVSKSGKSRFMRDICIRPDIKALYIDTENALSNEEYQYMKSRGVDIVAEQLLENIWGVVNDAIDDNDYDLIVVDSIGATTTQAEQDDDNTLSMATNVQRAKVLSKWLRGLNSHLMGKKTALVFVNHMKQNISGFGTTKPGGVSIDFHCMVQLQLGGGSAVGKTKKKLDVKLTKSRYNISGSKISTTIDLDPYKEEE